MRDISPVSASDIRQRRQVLRRQRRLRIVQVLWQVWAMAALTGGLFWAFTRPMWLIQAAQQIDITGNELMSDQTLQSLVPLDYPQSLLKVSPESISRQLLARAPLTEATVVRHLFPPKLEVHVQERQPVAIALPPSTDADAAPGDSYYVQVGLLDANGVWVPQSSFTGLADPAKLPHLEVKGMRSQYQKVWPELYQAIAQSPLQIDQIDWRDPTNLILHTELGPVHIGPYSYRFPEQLALLDQMRDLSQQLDNKQLAYIDLTNPDAPSVQIAQLSSPGSADQPSGQP